MTLWFHNHVKLIGGKVDNVWWHGFFSFVDVDSDGAYEWRRYLMQGVVHIHLIE